MSGCNSRQPHQFPISRAPACAAESPKLSLPGAAPGRLDNFHFGVVADKQCTCPASKLMRERYPPTPPFHCGENEIQASLISSASMGTTKNFRIGSEATLSQAPRSVSRPLIMPPQEGIQSITEKSMPSVEAHSG